MRWPIPGGSFCDAAANEQELAAVFREMEESGKHLEISKGIVKNLDLSAEAKWARYQEKERKAAVSRWGSSQQQ